MATTIPTGFGPLTGTPSVYPSVVPGAQQVVIPQITIPQPQQMFQPAPQTQAPQRSADLYRVHGMDGAKQFPTQPNSRYALFDEDEDIFYIKVTDQNNYPVSLKRFVFIEEDEPVPAAPQYVTMEEFNRFKEEMLNGKQSVRAEGGSASAVPTADARQTAGR